MKTTAFDSILEKILSNELQVETLVLNLKNNSSSSLLCNTEVKLVDHEIETVIINLLLII